MADENPQMQAEQPNEWRVELSTDWDVLGPFPMQAREQHFLSPSFPLNLSSPLDLRQTWPSGYADGGLVSWKIFQSTAEGDLKVSFPEIRWAALRATEGWAALQHHSVLRTSVTIYPPSRLDLILQAPRLSVQLTQASFFAVQPSSFSGNPECTSPIWYSGNIYDLEQALPQVVDLPVAPSTDSPTQYDLFISGDYEIRLFGDPRTYSDADTPVLSINLKIGLESPEHRAVRSPIHDVTCDFVNGFAFGDAFAFGMRSVDGWWTVSHIYFEITIEGLSMMLLRPIRIAPTQTRQIPIRLSQSKAINAASIQFVAVLTSGASTCHIKVDFTIRHVPQWTIDSFETIKASYFFAQSMATPFLVLPPIEICRNAQRPPLLALHGAGVRIFEQTFWPNSLRRQKSSWVIMPSGRSSWGLDWHGPSAQDAWATVDALSTILGGQEIWCPWRYDQKSPVILLGHSNGGQGAWYLSSRYPDRVVAVVPAAGYIKSQAYVPLSMSRSSHYVDPALRAILETALTPDDNDLFLSNLVNTPVAAIHGGDDNNVPTWHTREAISVLNTWNPYNAATYHEEPNKPHWWPSVLDNDALQEFIEGVSKSERKSSASDFTLTVALPCESGPLNGWRIESLKASGRLARLRVRKNSDGTVEVDTTNVYSFSIDLRVYQLNEILLNGRQTIIPKFAADKVCCLTFDGNLTDESTLQPSGRMQLVLTTTAPFVLVVPDNPSSRQLCTALRISHDVLKFHQLDSEVLTSAEAMHRVRKDTLGRGNIVMIANAGSAFSRWCLPQEVPHAFDINTAPMKMNGRRLESDSGVMFLHKHPLYPQSNVLFMLGDDNGLERATRLFPVRTGITVPDWLLVGNEADLLGSGGVQGAGGSTWGRNWSWEACAAWLD